MAWRSALAPLLTAEKPAEVAAISFSWEETWVIAEDEGAGVDSAIVEVVIDTHSPLWIPVMFQLLVSVRCSIGQVTAFHYVP